MNHSADTLNFFRTTARRPPFFSSFRTPHVALSAAESPETPHPLHAEARHAADGDRWMRAVIESGEVIRAKMTRLTDVNQEPDRAAVRDECVRGVISIYLWIYESVVYLTHTSVCV